MKLNEIKNLTESLNRIIAVKKHLEKPRPISIPCGCMGKTKDQPFCYCEMKWCENVNGSWYRIKESRTLSGIKVFAIKVA